MSNITTIPPLTPGGVAWRIHWDRIDKRVNYVAVDYDGWIGFYPLSPEKHKPLNMWHDGGKIDDYGDFITNIGPRPDWEELIFKRPEQ